MSESRIPFHETEHYNEIIKLTDKYADGLAMEYGPTEVALRLEEAALAAKGGDEEIRKAIHAELKKLLNERSSQEE